MLSSHHKEKRSKPSLDSVAINRLLNPSEETKDAMEDKENLPNAPTTISTTSASVKVSKRTITKVKPTLQSEGMNFLDENESEERSSEYSFNLKAKVRISIIIELIDDIFPS